MEEFSDVWFKQCAVIEFLTAEKVPPIEIHRRMISLKYLLPFIFYLSGGKTYQPALVDTQGLHYTCETDPTNATHRRPHNINTYTGEE
jgi:hypothetical protein